MKIAKSVFIDTQADVFALLGKSLGIHNDPIRPIHDVEILITITPNFAF